MPTLLTWAAPDEPLVSWSPPEVDVPPAEAEAPEPPDCEASPPLSGEATVIGALAVTGAFAAALGATSVAPTWPAAVESVTCCGASWALATAGANARPSVAAATAHALRII